MLLKRNLPFYSDVRHCSHPFMYIAYRLNQAIKTRNQFECDVTWSYFCLDFVYSYARSQGRIQRSKEVSQDLPPLSFVLSYHLYYTDWVQNQCKIS